MGNILPMILGGGSVIIIFLLLLIIGPSLFLWAINTLAEHSGHSFYIDHNAWSYLASFVLIIIVRGSNKRNYSK